MNVSPTSRERPDAAAVDALVDALVRDYGERAVTNATVRELRTLLAQLSPDQQQVVTLRLAGLDGGEICAVLGKSRSWVDTTQHRAIRRLRDLMGVTPTPEGT